MKKANSPYALLVRRQTFLAFKLPKCEGLYHLGREEAVQTVSSILNDYDVVVATTGMLSRELFEYRAKNNHGHERDFLTVGSMGHASAIALGIAVSKPSRQVRVCLVTRLIESLLFIFSRILFCFPNCCSLPVCVLAVCLPACRSIKQVSIHL